MAYDPQARKQSNSALIIGLISLLVLGGAALAYFATRQPAPETSPVLVNSRKETVIVNATPEPSTNTTIIVAPTADAPDTVVVTPPVNTNTTTTTTTTRNVDPAPRAPVAAPPADDKSSKTTVNNTIINPPAPNEAAKPIKPDAVKPDAADSGDVAANAAPAADGDEVKGY